MRLSLLAERLGLPMQGPDVEIVGVASLEQAGPDQLSFLADPKLKKLLGQSKAGAIICREDLADADRSALVSANPYPDFVRALHFFAKPQGSFQGVSEQAFVHPEAVIEDEVTLYPFAYIGKNAVIGRGSAIFPGCYVGEDCVLGPGCTLYPNVSLMAGSILGKNVILHPGCVIGADGFGYLPGPQGAVKIPQIGRVRVEDNVEIGANTCIDRAALHETRIGTGSKLDNLVQIGHNVELGPHCLIVSQVGISGSTKVGMGVRMAGQAGVADHLTIGDGATLGPKAAVGKDVAPGSMVGGMPAMERGTFMRTMILLPKLPEMAKRLASLEQELARLKASGAGDEHDNTA